MPTYLSFVAITPLIGITAMTTITSANTFVQTRSRRRCAVG